MEQNKLRCDRHKKACKNCKYGQCLMDCENCEISPLGVVLSCHCFDFDNSPKGSRCEYFKEEEK